MELPVQAAEQPKVFANSEHPTLPRLHHDTKGNLKLKEAFSAEVSYVSGPTYMPNA